MKFKTALLPLTMPLLLAACFGSGGSSSSSGQSGPLTLDSTPTAFTSFEDITANSLVQLDSPDIEHGGEAAPMSLNKAMELNNSNVPHAGGQVTGEVVTTNEPSFIRILSGDLDDEDDPELEAVRLSVGLPAADSIVVDFDIDDARDIDDTDYIAFELVDSNENVTDRLVVHAADDDADELDYLSFGVWQLDLLKSAGHFGGAAWGRVTEVDAMPDDTAPTAIYTGGLLGQHVSEADGSTTLYEAVSTVTANFGASTVTLSSSGTRNLETGVAFSALDLQMQAGQSAPLTGNYFVSADNALRIAGTDNVDGQFGGAFYGPDAEEVGGWFDITNIGNGARYFGSFGGKHDPF